MAATERSATLQTFAGELEPPSSNYAKAFADLIEGFGKSWIWIALAMQDTRLRYRGSVLGPFWLTFTIVIAVGSMGFLYAKLFKTNVHEYLPYLAAGMVFWQLIASTITDCCNCFVAGQSIIQQVRMPFSVHVYRILFRNLIVLGHTVVIIPIVLLLFQIPINWHIVLLVPGLALLSLDALLLGLILGMVSARFRDVPPIVQNLVQMLFFVTPIFWSPDLLGAWAGIARLNPLFAAIDILRSPILGPEYTPYISWLVMSGVTVVLAALAIPFFARFRARIPYWL